MDWQAMFNMSAGLLGAIGGWLLSTMWQAVRSLKTKVAAIDVLDFSVPVAACLAVYVLSPLYLTI